MIIKSFIAETDPKIFDNKILLFYGPNLGLKIEFKKKIKKCVWYIDTRRFWKARYRG